MSGTQPPPRFHIDQPNALSGDTARADLGRVFDRQTRKVGTADWDGEDKWVVFTPDARQPHLMHPPNVVPAPGISLVTLGDMPDRFIPLDHPDLYALVGIAIQGDRLDAIKRARVVFDLGLAEAKSLIESVLNEGAERGPITGVTLKDGRMVVVRQQDDDEAKERERRSMEALRAKDMNEAMADVFRGASVVENENGVDVVLHGTVYAPEVAERIARQIVDARVTHASVGPIRAEGGHMTGVSLGYTVKRRTLRADRSAEFGDAFDALEQVLSNLGLSEQYQSTLLASMDKHQPEILSAVLAVRELVTRAQDRADRLQAVLDAETGRKGLEGWTFQNSDGVHAWVFERDEINFATVHTKLSANGSQDIKGVFFIESNLTIVRDPSDWSCIEFQPTDALDGMEKATTLLREYGVLPALNAEGPPTI